MYTDYRSQMTARSTDRQTATRCRMEMPAFSLFTIKIPSCNHIILLILSYLMVESNPMPNVECRSDFKLLLLILRSLEGLMNSHERLANMPISEPQVQVILIHGIWNGYMDMDTCLY